MPTRRSILSTVAAGVALAAAGCSSSPPYPSCDVAAQSGCGDGLVCEPIETGGAVCAIPVVVVGHVVETPTGAPVGGARVVAMDANRSPISNVALTASDGAYAIRITAPRARDGSPLDRGVLLRADARGYRTFPSGIRQAFPISMASGALADGAFAVAGAQTEIALEPIPGASTASIHGVAAVPPGAPGVLVVAERQVGDAVVGASALADRTGGYALFNLPPGAYTVRAYARGAVHAPQLRELGEGEDARVDLPFSGPAGATVGGSVQLVNPGSGTGTSVVLIVESTFDASLVRGESPPGLRAPWGLVPDVKGEWAIPGVPPGRYVALAAHEDDALVRDPDPCIGGTQIHHLEVPQAGTVALPGFKVTGALEVISPGAHGPEVVAGTPVFTWKDDSSEDGYDLTVIDSLGEVVWATHVPGESGANPSVTYGGPALSPGGYYQFRVRSSKGTCLPTGAPEPVTHFISATEDLAGVFVVP